MAPAAAEPATAVAEELHWAGLPEEDLLVPLEEVMRMQYEDVGVEIEDDTPPRYRGMAQCHNFHVPEHRTRSSQ